MKTKHDLNYATKQEPNCNLQGKQLGSSRAPAPASERWTVGCWHPPEFWTPGVPDVRATKCWGPHVGLVQRTCAVSASRFGFFIYLWRMVSSDAQDASVHQDYRVDCGGRVEANRDPRTKFYIHLK